uniref:Uncharacterized protein n=1 Tax=Hucho hucho TaxID=62062 RepID=A0A4W5KP04_9TELE
MGQSVLRDGRTPFGREGRWPPSPPADRKGVWFRSPNPEWRRRAPRGVQCGNATDPGIACLFWQVSRAVRDRVGVRPNELPPLS